MVSIKFQQHCGYFTATLMQRCFDVVSTLRNVVLTLFQRRGATLYQRCTMLKNQRRKCCLKCWLGSELVSRRQDFVDLPCHATENILSHIAKLKEMEAAEHANISLIFKKAGEMLETNWAMSYFSIENAIN